MPFKTGDAVTWYVSMRGDGDYHTLYYVPTNGFVVSMSEHGCVVGENETGRVFWFDNSRLTLTREFTGKALSERPW